MAKLTINITGNDLEYLKKIAKEEGESWQQYATRLFTAKLWEDRELYDVWFDNND